MITYSFIKYFRLVESAPRITVHTLDTVDSCTHEVALPPGQEFTPLSKPSGEPAKTYPFTLDPFQEQVILIINKCAIFLNEMKEFEFELYI